MLSFSDIKKMFSYNLQNDCSIEIEFLIKGEPQYQECWMGKMLEETNPEKELYWYGFVPNGKGAYDYDNFDAFSVAPVFNGKSLKEIWDRIEILSIDGCDPQERFLFYLK